MGGLVTHVRATTRYEHTNGSLYYTTADSNTDYGYVWWDAGLKSTETVNIGGAISTSTMSYDAGGRLKSAYVDDSSPFTINYVTDVQGQVLKRTQTNNAIKNTYFYFNGLKVADLQYNGATLQIAALASQRRARSPQTKPSTPNAPSQNHPILCRSANPPRRLGVSAAYEQEVSAAHNAASASSPYRTA